VDSCVEVHMKSSPFSLHIQQKLSAYFEAEISIISAEMVHGGSINECFVLHTTQGDFFLKRNDAVEFPEMFEHEKEGLQLLHQAGALQVPKVYFSGSFKSSSYLVLEFLEKDDRIKSETNSAKGWEVLGHGLARIHQQHGEHYGWKNQNYIGSLIQVNQENSSWWNFYVQQRLEPMAMKALLEKKISRNLYEQFQKLYVKLEHLFPIELPALLHGDLWSGNVMILDVDKAALFDPAVYYGHREMDIAMSKLFGGFHPRFYKAYQESFPLQSGWEERVEIAQLYPLLVHACLFGGGYPKQIEAILKKWE